jgi:hypothetical protein
MKRFFGVAFLFLVASAMVSATGASAQQNGRPDGSGADACHLLHPGGNLAQVVARYTVGNPDQVLLAGDCDGGPIGYVDDGLSLTVENPNGSSASGSWDFYDFCGGTNTGGPALDVTDLFGPGVNDVSLTLDNDCGGTVETTPLYLVVRQHA